MYFCIRDDDTNFFTTPEDLEHAYGEISRWGPVSLAIIPFCRPGTNQAVPDKFRDRMSIHPLHKNPSLVEYLRQGISQGRYEAMLHGFHHDEEHGRPEFAQGSELASRVTKGKKYLEDLLAAPIRVFVPPHNTIGHQGLRAIAREGLHLGGVAGVRGGWPLTSLRTWSLWWRLYHWRKNGGLGVPWILDLKDHYEIAGNAVTPRSSLQRNEATFQQALTKGGVFCAATHYWELDTPSLEAGAPTVGEQLRKLIVRAQSDSRVVWRSVGEIVSAGSPKV
jgi:predicted deacetylase